MRDGPWFANCRLAFAVSCCVIAARGLLAALLLVVGCCVFGVSLVLFGILVVRFMLLVTCV